MDKKLIFISCGQYSQDEKDLGLKIVEIIRENPNFEAFYAENQCDLRGLSQNIFKKLHEAVGFIAIMHHRGKLQMPEKEIIRASVWIEQEIAIASFIEEILQKKIKVIAFIQEGIHLEGVRTLLMLNPYKFTKSEEVSAKVKEILPVWARELGGDEFELIFERENEFEHPVVRPCKYKILVYIKNNGNKDVSTYRVDLRLPRDLLERNTTYALHKESLTDTHIGLRASQNNHNHKEICAGDKKLIMGESFFIYWPSDLDLTFYADLSVEGELRDRAEKKIRDLIDKK